MDTVRLYRHGKHWTTEVPPCVRVEVKPRKATVKKSLTVEHDYCDRLNRDLLPGETHIDCRGSFCYEGQK